MDMTVPSGLPTLRNERPQPSPYQGEREHTMTPEERLTPQQRALYEAISDVSEARWCAGWLMGIEYQLWAELHDAGSRQGTDERDDAQLETVRTLSDAVGGWIIWADDQTHPDLPTNEWGPRFVPLPEWLAMVAAERHESAHEAETPQ